MDVSYRASHKCLHCLQHVAGLIVLRFIDLKDFGHCKNCMLTSREHIKNKKQIIYNNVKINKLFKVKKI